MAEAAENPITPTHFLGATGTGPGSDVGTFGPATARAALNVADGASANATDAALRDRSTHTGVQAQSTVTNLAADLAAKADLASPAFSGTPTAPTAAPGTNTQQLANMAALQAGLAAVTGGLVFKGTWNASTNTPTLSNGSGDSGEFYIVSVAGTTNIDGINSWDVGDWIISDNTTWRKIDQVDAVSSVFGRTGVVTAQPGDYTAAQVTETAAAKVMTSAERIKLAGIETAATADQTEVEIETAYNAQVAVVAQLEAEAGTATTVRRWTAQRVAQAIAALAPTGGGGGGAGDPNGSSANATVSVTLGTTEVQIGTVTLTPQSTTAGVQVLAWVQATKDNNATARTMTLRVRRGTTNGSPQVGGDLVVTSMATANYIYSGSLVGGLDEPASTSAVVYSVRAVLGAGASTATRYALHALEVPGTGGGGGGNAFGTIAVSGQSDVVADAATDTLTLVAGSNVTLTTSAAGDSVTIAASGGGAGTVDVDVATQFGALGDAVRYPSAGAMIAASAVLTVTGGGFVPGDVGKAIIVVGVGAAGIQLVSTISAYTSATQVTLAHAAGTTASGKHVVYGTDNSTALLALRTFIRLDYNRVYRIYFKSGYYIYTDNRWLRTIPSVIIDAWGCKFQCIGSPSFEETRSVWSMNSMWQILVDGGYGVGATFGYKFNTAAAGATSLTLTTSGDASNFAVGDPVFIYGFDQQFSGYPPNMRWYEWNKITAIAAGVLTLQGQTKQEYRSDWRDNSDPTGAARVISLKRSGNMLPEFIEINGADLKSYEASAGEGLVIIASDQVRLNGVKYDGDFWPQQTREVINTDCTFLANMEADKQVDRLLFSRCKIYGNITAATGINDVIFEDCTTYNTITTSPRRLTIRRSTLINPPANAGAIISNYGSYYPTERMTVEDNRIYHDGAMLWLIDNLDEAGGAVKSFTIDAVGTKGEILLADSQKDATILNLMEGAFCFKSDLSQMGRITKIGYNGTQFVLEHSINGTITAGNTYRYDQIQRIETRNNVFHRCAPKPSVRTWRAHERAAPVVIRYTAGDFPFDRDDTSYQDTFWVKGFLRSTTIRVMQPYTGPDGSSLFSIYCTDAAGTQILTFEVDLKTAGIHEQTWTRAPTATGSGLLTNRDWQRAAVAPTAFTLLRRIDTLFHRGFAPISYTSASQVKARVMPKLDVEMVIDPVLS